MIEPRIKRRMISQQKSTAIPTTIAEALFSQEAMADISRLPNKPGAAWNLADNGVLLHDCLIHDARQ